MPSPCTMLVVWDIDHTLIRPFGASWRVYKAALERLGLASGAVQADSTSTDGTNLWNHLVDQGCASSKTYVALLAEIEAEALAAVQRGEMGVVQPVPGVIEALATLQDLAARQTVATGNVRATALAKLGVAGLAKFLDIELAAFGDDPGVTKAELISVPVRAAESSYGQRPDVLVIGDSVDDVRGARQGGFRAIGVTTGSASRQQLEVAGANLVLDDLSDLVVELRRSEWL